jgi:hypothetical protein
MNNVEAANSLAEGKPEPNSARAVPIGVGETDVKGWNGGGPMVENRSHHCDKASHLFAFFFGELVGVGLRNGPESPKKKLMWSI